MFLLLLNLLFHNDRVFLPAAAPLKSLPFNFLVHHIRLKRPFINRKILCSRQTINMRNRKIVLLLNNERVALRSRNSFHLIKVLY